MGCSSPLVMKLAPKANPIGSPIDKYPPLECLNGAKVIKNNPNAKSFLFQILLIHVGIVIEMVL